MITRCQSVEKYMLGRSFACPVYFIEQSADVMDVYRTLQSKSGVLSVMTVRAPHLQPSNVYTLNVKFPRNKSPQPLPEIRTLESVLEGQKEGVSPASLPSILLTASYDTFSLVPSLASPQADGAASTVGLLSILRMFRRLYDDQKTAGR